MIKQLTIVIPLLAFSLNVKAQSTYPFAKLLEFTKKHTSEEHSVKKPQKIKRPISADVNSKFTFINF